MRSYQAGSKLYFLLDSLDECQLGIPNLATWLAAQLKQYVIEPQRIFLRIACRTGAWPKSLEQAISELWSHGGKEQNVQAYELCPLRREDVRVAAQMNDISPEQFLATVEELEIESLANRPATLEFLLQLWRTGSLPRSKTSI